MARLAPVAAVRGAGLQFEVACDELGEYELAALAGADGQLWLCRYIDSPVEGYDVLADVTVTRDEALSTLEQAGFSDLVAWRTPLASFQVEPGSATPISALPGLHSTEAVALQEAGVDAVEALVAFAAAPGGPPALARDSGIPPGRLQALARAGVALSRPA